MARPKIERKMREITLHMFADQHDDIRDLLPGMDMNPAIRLLLDKIIKMIKEARNRAGKMNESAIVAEIEKDLKGDQG